MATRTQSREEEFTQCQKSVLQQAKTYNGAYKEDVLRVVETIIEHTSVLGECKDSFKARRDEILICNTRAMAKVLPRIRTLIDLGLACKQHDYRGDLAIMTWNVISNWGAGLADDAGGFETINREGICMLNRVFQQAYIIGKSGAGVLGVVELDYEPIFTALLELLGYKKISYIQKLNCPGLYVRQDLQLNEANADGAALYVHENLLLPDYGAQSNLEVVPGVGFQGTEYDWRPEYLSHGKPRTIPDGSLHVATGSSATEFAKSPSKTFRQVPLLARLRLNLHGGPKQFVFAVVHLSANKHVGGELDRLEQYQQLERRVLSLCVGSASSASVVIMGDFNADNQLMEVKGIVGSFYGPQLCPYMYNSRVLQLTHPQLNGIRDVKRVTSKKTRTVNGVKQTYAYTPDRIMASNIDLFLNLSVISSLTSISDRTAVLTTKLPMPSTLLPSDHEPVLVSTAPSGESPPSFRNFPAQVDVVDVDDPVPDASVRPVMCTIV